MTNFVSFQEAQALNTLGNALAICRDGIGWSTFCNEFVPLKKQIDMLKTNATAMGLELDIIIAKEHGQLNGKPEVGFMLTHTRRAEERAEKRAKRNGVTLKLNVTRVQGERFILCNPVNLDFAPKPKRIEHLRQFMQAWDQRSEFIGIQPGMEKAFVDRLFEEGMLQRNPQDANLFKPTTGGRVWFERATAE